MTKIIVKSIKKTTALIIIIIMFKNETKKDVLIVLSYGVLEL